MRKALPKKLKDEVKARFRGRCGYCGEEHQKLQIDHIHPVCRAHHVKDVNDPSNLMPACFSCNNYKLNRSLEDFRTDLQEQVARASRTSLNFRLAERYGLISRTGAPVRFYFENLDSDMESK